ncbi:gephyrin-like molybdotransferase Glp [Caldimonas tepidiphila]|uniref:molybdopterin molybdotransferase MoeA n=1 Tax=Caldimonas tepidiphila TaxID=2315841 RepID=UPI000E5A2976|nr:gephyrin-like molybdotransferase Glp [Caldimonas tepidiphila]
MNTAPPSTPSPGRPPLLSLPEAQAKLFAALTPIAERERLPTFDALGRVLAADLVSPLDVPPHDNSSMDGYALRAADVAAAGTVLPVAQRIAAGQVGAELEPGTAARIFTGAPMPAGADAVVMQEDTEALEGGAVRIQLVPQPGQWVRARGEDVRSGTVTLPRGTRLTPQALGLAATVGAAEVDVVRRPRVALFSTGDELVMPGEPLPPGAIYNSNRTMLCALLQQLGCEVSDLGIVPDRLDATREALRSAAGAHDLILTSGGVSAGEEDHIKPAVQAEGRLEAMQLATKPGRPMVFGEIRHGGARPALFMGLPGNPVSSFLTFVLLVRPVLLALQGVPHREPRAQTLPAEFDWPKADRRREFLRARRTDTGGVEIFPNQSSGVLTSVFWGDGFVDNPPGQTIRRGDAVRFLPFTELLS